MTEGHRLAARLRAARERVLVGAQHAAPGVGSRRDEWSVIEILSHLVDVDRHWLSQALAIKDNPNHVFVQFDDEAWKREHPNARDEPLASVMVRLRDSHAEVISTLESFSDTDLARAAYHPTRGRPYKVADVFNRYPAHDANHAAQIAGIYGLKS